jgi:hypothetical protein
MKTGKDSNNKYVSLKSTRNEKKKSYHFLFEQIQPSALVMNGNGPKSVRERERQRKRKEFSKTHVMKN